MNFQQHHPQHFESVSFVVFSRSSEPLAAMASLNSRMDKIVPKLKELVKQHNEGTYPWGIEAFNNEIESVLEEGQMFSEEMCLVDQVATHPDNR